jgi:copper oxidase (laccase) domain-containing protein
MERAYGTDPADLVVHFGSSIAAHSYVLPYLGETLRKEAWRPYLREVDGAFETDIVGYVIQRLLEKGVRGENISRSPVDTFGHPDYFSFVEHSTDPKNIPDGRNGFIAVLLEQEARAA